MKWAEYRRFEERIVARSADEMVARWKWGRALLSDTARMTVDGGSLRHGERAKLLAQAEADGFKLNAQEVQRRLRAARAYTTEDEMRIAAICFSSWYALVQAGFPPVEVPEPDPGRERTFDAQGVFWPLDHYDETSTLAELVKHAESVEQVTSARQRKDLHRRGYLDRLIEVAEGDLFVSWGEAVTLAGGEPEQLSLFLRDNDDVIEDEPQG